MLVADRQLANVAEVAGRNSCLGRTLWNVRIGNAGLRQPVNSGPRIELAASGSVCCFRVLRPCGRSGQFSPVIATQRVQTGTQRGGSRRQILQGATGKYFIEQRAPVGTPSFDRFIPPGCDVVGRDMTDSGDARSLHDARTAPTHASHCE
jgi:hypothetical protein